MYLSRILSDPLLLSIAKHGSVGSDIWLVPFRAHTPCACHAALWYLAALARASCWLPLHCHMLMCVYLKTASFNSLCFRPYLIIRSSSSIHFTVRPCVLQDLCPRPSIRLAYTANSYEGNSCILAVNFLNLCSLVPRPFEERKGLVHIACTCAGFSMVTGRVSIVTSPGCTVVWTVNGRIYDDIPQFFLGSPGACARNVYLSLSLLKGPGYEAKICVIFFYPRKNLTAHSPMQHTMFKQKGNWQ